MKKILFLAIVACVSDFAFANKASDDAAKCEAGEGKICREIAADKFIARDFAAGKRYLEMGCDKNDRLSCAYLGEIYYFAEFRVEQNQDKGKQLLDRACELGSVSRCDFAVLESAPPKAQDLQVFEPTADLRIHAKTYRNDLTYKKTKKRKVFYDENGKYSEKEVEGGFYREYLGKTADGNLIAQDFYQDNDAPLTPIGTVLSLKNIPQYLQDRKVKLPILSGNNLDTIINFYPNGRIKFFRQEKFIKLADKQVKEEDRNYKQYFFYPNGKIASQTERENNQIRAVSFYKESGNIASFSDTYIGQYSDNKTENEVIPYSYTYAVDGIPIYAKINQKMHFFDKKGNNASGMRVLKFDASGDYAICKETLSNLYKEVKKSLQINVEFE
ncbi:MAG: hypothetical protein IJ566_06555 [Cardiobacteriaceae bacterium]|nr:hypothetical protein [Cardiobacteriaceae bacterium]